MKASEMVMIADMIVSVLKHPQDETVLSDTRKKVHELCRAFPIYPE
jgi:glycine/serine hydroxymethyltransferase